MPKIKIELTEQTVALIERYVSEATHVVYEEQLTLESLAALLLEDVALVVRRPGCWEAANMQGVLISHGYYRKGDV